MELKTLEKRWKELFYSDNAESEFTKLFTLYNEKTRFYHTLEHIQFCLKQFDDNYNKIEHPDELELSIWYHDIIYDPKKINNEELSAHYAEKSLSLLGVSHKKINKIKHLIMVTKHPSLPETNDEKFLIDFDLAILGTNEDTYKQYANMIKREYSFLSTKEYNEGRKKVLNNFINAESIFHTNLFKEKYETLARKNINIELNELIGKSGVFDL